MYVCVYVYMYVYPCVMQYDVCTPLVTSPLFIRCLGNRLPWVTVTSC
jgi:hypothetical protein